MQTDHGKGQRSVHLLFASALGPVAKGQRGRAKDDCQNGQADVVERRDLIDDGHHGFTLVHIFTGLIRAFVFRRTVAKFGPAS